MKKGRTWQEKLFFALLFVLVLLDQITKSLLRGDFSFLIVSLEYSQNYGSAFSMFSSVLFYPYLMIALSSFVLVILYLKKEYFLDSKLGFYGLLFAIAGIIGNLIDRILFMYVRDIFNFLDLFIFNFADFYLTLAFVLLLVWEFFPSQK